MSLKAKIEAVLYMTEKPLRAQAIAGIVGEDLQLVRTTLLELIHEYEERQGGLEIADEDGYSFQVRDQFANLMDQFLPIEMTAAQLRTLSAIAIKQPIMQSEIIRIRGASAYDHIKELVIRGLISKREDEGVRSPMLTVTKAFQEYFRLTKDGKSLRTYLKKEMKKKDKEEELLASPPPVVAAFVGNPEDMYPAEDALSFVPDTNSANMAPEVVEQNQVLAGSEIDAVAAVSNEQLNVVDDNISVSALADNVDAVADVNIPSVGDQTIDAPIAEIAVSSGEEIATFANESIATSVNDLVATLGNEMAANLAEEIAARSGDEIVVKPGDEIVAKPDDEILAKPGDEITAMPGDGPSLEKTEAKAELAPDDKDKDEDKPGKETTPQVVSSVPELVDSSLTDSFS